jgi:hypothetical protein
MDIAILWIQTWIMQQDYDVKKKGFSKCHGSEGFPPALHQKDSYAITIDSTPDL